MKILFYITPWPENPKTRDGRYNYLKGRLRNFMSNLNSHCVDIGETFEIKTICSNHEGVSPEHFPEKYIKPIFIDLKEIKHIFSSYKESLFSWNASKEKEVIDFFKKKLGNFVPDLVIALTPCDFLKKLFPKSPVFIMEAGFFSRPPFPFTQYFDTNSLLYDTFPSKFEKDILKKTLYNKATKNFVKQIENKYRKILIKNSGISRKDLDPKNKYKKILLLPLQFDNSPSFEYCCKYKNQVDLAETVLRKLKKDYLLIITLHPLSEINTNSLKNKLSKKYDNFLIIEKIGNETRNLSQKLLLSTDGVITVSSSIGLQAALFKKYCICLGESHIKPFSDADNLNNIDKVLSKKIDYKVKSRLIYYLFTHYYIPFVYLTEKPEWTYMFFSRLVSKYIKCNGNIDINFYNKLGRDKEILTFYRGESGETKLKRFFKTFLIRKILMKLKLKAI